MLALAKTATVVQSPRGNYAPEDFPGIDQTVVQHIMDAMIGVAERERDGLRPAAQGTFIDRQLMITKSMLGSRFLRDAPTEFKIHMDPMERRFYQERALLELLEIFLKREATRIENLA